jgi:cytochrome b pre-mRNA-processing protein 3
MGLLGLFRRKPHERAGFALYTAAVTAARDPWHYGPAVGAPDTLDGRFDLIGLAVALLIRRVRTDPDPRAGALAQAVFDAMFADMDVTLRELGVSDLTVGKRVKRMWEAFHGRARAYEAALDAGDAAALEAALLRNLWRVEPGTAAAAAHLPGAAALAGAARRVAAALGAQEFAALLRGEVRFPGQGAAAPADGDHRHA